MPNKTSTSTSSTSSHYEHSITDLAKQLHNLARNIHPAPHSESIRVLADELTLIGKSYHEYTEGKKMYDSSKFVIGL